MTDKQTWVPAVKEYDFGYDTDEGLSCEARVED